MRLGQLRNLVNNYDLTFYSRKLYYGDHERAISIKKFLKSFNEGDDYHLNLIEQFQLAKLLCPMSTDLALVRHMKSEFTSATEFFQVFSFLQSRDFKDELLEQILLIPPIYYIKLFNLLFDLEKNKQLNNESIQKLFLLLRNKIPKPEEEHFIINQVDAGDLAVTEYKKKQGDFQVFVKQNLNKTELAGGRGAILMGSKSLTDNSTQYMVKILKEIQVNKVKENDTFFVRREKAMLTGVTATEAIRETKYARFLGRESYFFQYNNRWHIISEWQTGQALHNISTRDRIAIPIKMRLTSLIHLLKELSLLHDEYRVHGDIKFQNCVYDQQSQKLKLIDFGSARKVKPKNHSIAFTQNYLDNEIRLGWVGANYIVNYTFCDDIYALGIVIAFLFPDIFVVLQSGNNTQITLCKNISSLSLEEKGVYYLVSSMINQDRKARCTCKDALLYCNSLLKDFDNINKNHLEKIYDATLNKNVYSFEDIVHDHSPPL